MTAGLREEAEAEGVRLGFPVSATAPVTDEIGDADPFAGLDGDLGWLLAYVAFLREPLAALRAQPDDINANVAKLRSAAAETRSAAHDHHGTDLGDRLASLAEGLDGTADVAAVSGRLVTGLRAMVFDLAAALATDLARLALLATATARHTGGGSIVACRAAAHTRAAATGARISRLMVALQEALGRQADRLTRLNELMAEAAPPHHRRPTRSPTWWSVPTAFGVSPGR